MLISLRVKNLALVESVQLDFQPGLNVITGETGAGKSILLGALALLLGERADRKMIRDGADACSVEAQFQLDDTQAIDALLGPLGLEPLGGEPLIIRRILKASGASQIVVNDSPLTLQALRQIGDLLVDMHGPHDHQSLLHPAFQLELLDAYGETGALRTAYLAAYERVAGLEAERDRLQGDDQDVEGRIDLLSYRVREIEDAAPVAGEEEAVAQEQMVVSHAQRILELGGALAAGLIEGEGSVFDRLAEAQKQLEELARLMPEGAAWREEARGVAAQVQELASTLASAMERVEADPARLEWLDQRLAIYQKLRRKYGPTIEDVLRNLETSKQKLKDLQTRGERLAALGREIAAAAKERDRHGLALRKKRVEVSGSLAKAVTRELRELGFPHGEFRCELREVEAQRSGLDGLEFGFAPNLGESARALRDIASSGEISRVMLACKAVLAGHDRIPVLVFDEVDANLGGEMGHAVGRKLAALGEGHQVLCITHLPQVAVAGGAHFAVRKEVQDGRTVTRVQSLDAKDRVEEIARMLGGRDLTKVTLQHAREMLKQG